jgi:hypothetical protein
MNTLAKSFLENFGLRAFGGWRRPARPGMENGMFAYDESTAELFDVEEAEEPRVSFGGAKPRAARSAGAEGPKSTVSNAGA